MIHGDRVSAGYTDALEAEGVCRLLLFKLESLKEEAAGNPHLILDISACASAASVVGKCLDRISDVFGDIEWNGAHPARWADTDRRGIPANDEVN